MEMSDLAVAPTLSAGLSARSYDFLIVGGGILGLAAARALVQKRPDARVAVLEKESEVGRHASGRNSGVLHSGIYYPPGSLKARFCAQGREAMVRFAEENGIPCETTGKVIIPTDEAERIALKTLLDNARANGIGAELLDAAAIREIEPHAACWGEGVFCPETGIIDAKRVLFKLRDWLRDRGVEFFFDDFLALASDPEGMAVTHRCRYAYGVLINCAGAHADRVARLMGLARNYRLLPFKGIYHQLRPKRGYLVRGNIYPVPDPDFPFLGVHFSRTTQGEVYVGPTAVPALGRENYGWIRGLQGIEALQTGWYLGRLYRKNPGSFRRLVHEEISRYCKRNFFRSARKLIPELNLEDLIPSPKVGIRPQLMDTRRLCLVTDYVVERGPRSVHLLNAISPAFTCAFPFGEWVAGLVSEGAVPLGEVEGGREE